jgi:hypothetical protein
MPKILVLDHTLNSESMASCSLEHKNSQFFGVNTAMSIDENLDMCKPDQVLINKHFITKELLYQMLNRFSNRVRVYDVDYIIPNFYVKSKVLNNNKKHCIICLHEHSMIRDDELISIKNTYAPIYSYNTEINHPQMAGFFGCAKDLFEVCDSYGSIIDASGGYLTAFCKFYGWQYGVFKPSETISILEPTEINKTYLTNKEIYEQNL